MKHGYITGHTFDINRSRGFDFLRAYNIAIDRVLLCGQPNIHHAPSLAHTLKTLICRCAVSWFRHTEHLQISLISLVSTRSLQEAAQLCLRTAGIEVACHQSVVQSCSLKVNATRARGIIQRNPLSLQGLPQLDRVAIDSHLWWFAVARLI